jgi:PIN domain nuclease of toxin-antitoxin system
MKYLIDSYAWMGYFMGTKAGEKVKPVIEGAEEKITPTICLAEIYAKTLQVEGEEMAENREHSLKRKAP